MRAHLAAHAFPVGGFTASYRLGSFSRLTLARRVFGRARVDGEIARLRAVLAGWGHSLGHADDQLLPDGDLPGPATLPPRQLPYSGA